MLQPNLHRLQRQRLFPLGGPQLLRVKGPGEALQRRLQDLNRRQPNPLALQGGHLVHLQALPSQEDLQVWLPRQLSLAS